MLLSYLKSAFRNLRRFKLYSIINIAGLAIGMAVFILIMQFVRFQLSFDRYNKNADRIYRVTWRSVGTAGGFPPTASTQELLAPALKQEFPQIESVVRIEKHYPEPALVSFGDKKFYEKRFLEADSTFLDIFTFKFVEGDPGTAFRNPNSIVITSSTAKKYFGSEDPMGKVLTVDNEGKYTVTGVINDVPANSQFHFDLLACKTNWSETEWYMFGAYTYILLKRGMKPSDLEKQFPAFIDKYVTLPFTKERISKIMTFGLQPLTWIHLHSNLSSELEPNGDIRYVEIFSAIAVLILLIACVNYANISTSRYLRRITEIGVRKAIGAERRTLIVQILLESVLLSVVAMLVAVVVVELLFHIVMKFFPGILLPSLTYQGSFSLLLLVLGLAIITGIFSGGYPAFYISRLNPVEMLKMSSAHFPVTLNLRKVLVVFQFTVATLIVLTTFVLFNQLHFVENTRLGFDKENVVVINDQTNALGDNYEAFKNDLLQSPSIVSVSSGDQPGGPEGLVFFIYRDKKPVKVRIMDVDRGYLRTLGLRVAEGRGFSSLSDTSDVLVNQTFARVFDLKNVVGTNLRERMHMHFPLGRVIGVVKDFHMNSLRDPIPPIALRLKPYEYWKGNVIVRIAPNSFGSALSAIRTDWKKFVPNRPVEYSFLSDDLNRLYTSDQRLANLFGVFAVVGIFIACLGLFGLSALVAEQRTKEVGIRKAVGASVSDIVSLLSKEFLLLVLVSNLFAWPIAYFALNKWLRGFAYRINLGVWIFVLAGVMVLVISLITVSYQAIRAATANPVDSLRYE